MHRSCEKWKEEGGVAAGDSSPLPNGADRGGGGDPLSGLKSVTP